MEHPNEDPPRYIGYPQPVEGPTIPYKKIPDSNPVVRGTLLVIGAWLSVLNPQRLGPRLTPEKVYPNSNSFRSFYGRMLASMYFETFRK
jgi:hypothetical protein